MRLRVSVVSMFAVLVQLDCGANRPGVGAL